METEKNGNREKWKRKKGKPLGNRETDTNKPYYTYGLAVMSTVTDLPNFGGSLLFMRTSFVAELPNLA